MSKKKEIDKKGNEKQKFEIFVENFNKKVQEIAADFNIIYDLVFLFQFTRKYVLENQTWRF